MSHVTTHTPGGRERQFVFGPERVRATILTTAADTDGRHDLVYGVLPPDAMVPLHQHSRYEERLWVESGSMTVWAGADKATLHSGDYYHVPLNVPHTYHAGPEGSRAIIISSPAGFAEVIARAGTPLHLAASETEFDADLAMAVAAELGDTILGPPGTTPADLTNQQDT
ncbi:MAG: cupin domain-containing protein [Nocardiopsaceae bacterium]|jgi:quercetin dioxygenase-like cupin family protein|nr:cupin domain-containing protein [Nocardiopsaceae bacterium]